MFLVFFRTFSASEVTNETLSNIYKVGLHLERLCLVGCGIRKLPENLFLFLPKVKHVDLRHNFLISLPDSLAYHPTLEVLLLSENLFPSLPPLLYTLPRLKMHGITKPPQEQKRIDSTNFINQCPQPVLMSNFARIFVN